jgi:cytochrome c oxidase subunit 2
MNPWGPFAVFLVVGGAWTVAWALVVLRASGPPHLYEPIYQASGRLRRLLFGATVGVLLVVLLVSVGWFPYPPVAAARLGPPSVRVAVTAQMWQWTLSRTALPAGATVEFDVTSRDVNHGFAIYGPSGRLVAQVQAMPGYTNRLLVHFTDPGQYLVRCLEYCGIPHIGMATAFQVGGRGDRP